MPTQSRGEMKKYKTYKHINYKTYKLQCTQVEKLSNQQLFSLRNNYHHTTDELLPFSTKGLGIINVNNCIKQCKKSHFYSVLIVF